MSLPGLAQFWHFKCELLYEPHSGFFWETETRGQTCVWPLIEWVCVLRGPIAGREATAMFGLRVTKPSKREASHAAGLAFRIFFGN